MKKNSEEYIYKNPLELLKEFEEENSSKEILFTFGSEEIVKEDGKYYLSNTKNPSINREITREAATEMWQSFNMKKRSDTFINIDLDNNKFTMV